MINIKMDVNTWHKQFKLDGEVILKVSKETIKETATALYTKIIDYTPVGNPSLWHSKYVPHNYKPGTLKQGWKIAFAPTEVTISNNLPYAQRIEFGWSTQAPYGMMRRSITEFPSLLNQFATKNKK